MYSLNMYKLVSTIFGCMLAAVEVLLNSAAAAKNGDWFQLGVIATAIITAAGAAAIPIAERAWQNGSRVKSLALVFLFFPLVLALSFTSGLERTSSQKDAKLAANVASANKSKVAQATYDVALAARERECHGRRNGTTACKRAERALLRITSTTVANITGMAQGFEDGASRRLAAALSFLGANEDNVRMWLPFVMPTALLLGGFLFIAIGISPDREQKYTPKAEIVQVEVPTTVTVPEPKTEREARDWFVNRISRSSGRKLDGVPLRVLAGECGVPHSTLAAWVQRWGENGTIVISRDGRIASYSLPSIRAVV
jgi:hypothetical protein